MSAAAFRSFVQITTALGLREFYNKHAYLSRPVSHLWLKLDPAAVFHQTRSDRSVRATPDLYRVIFPVRVDIDQREVRPFALRFDRDDVLVAFSAGFEFDDIAAVVALALQLL